MKTLLALLALAALPAAAELTSAQLANKVRAERRQWDNSADAARNAADKSTQARDRKREIGDNAQKGATHDKVGGERCKIDNCLARQERVVKRKEAAEAKAIAKAKAQAEEYLAAEEAYKAKTGNYLNPSTADEAKTYLEGTSAISGDPPTSTGGEGGPSGPGCVDQRGIPCIGDGTTDFESPTGTVDPAAPVVDEDYAPANPGGGGGGGGPPGTNIGDIATGHEGQDLSKYAARGAQTMGVEGGPGVRGSGFSGGERVALAGGAYSVDLAALRAEIARGAAGNARGTIDEMLRRMPRDPRAHLFDAQARNAAGDWEGAETAARRALALDPRNAAAYKELAVALLHQGKDAEALEAAENAAALDPEDADAQMLMAFAFEGLGRKDEMMKAVERAAELDPGRFSSYLKLARMGKRLFDRRRAVKGWHGIPVPAPGSDPAMAAPAAAGPTLTEGSRSRVLFLGGALLVVAVLTLLGAVWKKRQDQQAFKLRG